MVTQYKNLIGGEMVATDRWLDVVNPANEQVIGQVPHCGKAELDKAVAAARAAFKTWKNTPIEERRAAIMAISGAIKRTPRNSIASSPPNRASPTIRRAARSTARPG